ncbi:M28 family peptidase [Actinomadura darangshiensis]|uniref:M28 family peptidase n=1 Tax=Actinomadura darangshiensis TaxID=705336 RepID=A0A4R5BE56_9ACTN|nr:M28 family peptidase [Actinomadura darangshiensis]
MVELYRMLPNNADFTPLSEAGFEGMNFAWIERGSHHHTATDSIANLDRGSLQHQGATMLALTRTLGNTDLADLDGRGDKTYFRLPGTMVDLPRGDRAGAGRHVGPGVRRAGRGRAESAGSRACRAR